MRSYWYSAVLLGSAVAGCQSAAAPPDNPTVRIAAAQYLQPVPVRQPSNRSAPPPVAVPPAERREPPTPTATAVALLTPVNPPLNWGRCLRWVLCQYEGLCTATDDGRCIAADDEDCRPSDACLGGRCTAKDGQCMAGSDADCRGSRACSDWGRCFHDGHGVCMAAQVSDCQASNRCRHLGECTLLDHACVRLAP
ncbi:MAG: hypothetical protein JRI23_35705 [Deltaproteobacteria bacterium]|nr:hypothetical protein [Deltaproteobacteria bacterium]MBW2537678.1 hypothetical protein [Deltaproteobacteria bacterium]